MPADRIEAIAGRRCADLAEHLAGMVEGSHDLADDDVAHLEQCLRCQADVVQYRRLLRALRSLRAEVRTPAPGLLADILAGLEEAGERHAVRGVLHSRRAAYLGGIAAATAAGAAGAIVIASRSRRLKLVG